MNFQFNSGFRNQGYILLPVVILIAAIAAIALLSSQQSAMNLQLANNEFDNTQAEYIAQAGMQHAIKQAGQQGCGPFTDLNNVALGDHSYSTTLTTSLGTTDSYNLTVDQDNWLKNDSPDNNKGNDTLLRLVFSSTKDYRPMYRYDLSSIPPGATILSATAWFYVEKAHPEGPATIHRITENWTETGATWNNMNNNHERTTIATIPPQPANNEWVAVNLTAQVQAWVNGQANHGIMLKTDNEEINADYSSRDSANAPYLQVITGSPPAPGSSITASSNLANGASRSLTRQNIQLQQIPILHHSYQPGADAMDDSRMKEGETVKAYGIDNEIKVQEDDIRGLLRFELPDALPKGAVLKSVSLDLYSEGVNRNGDILVHSLERDWVEGDCDTAGCGVDWTTYDGSNNWTSPGGDYDNEVIAQISTSGANKWYSLDITDIARQWLNGDRENHGLLLRGGDNIDIRFNSSDHSDGWTHPRLILGYTCACGENCLLPQGSGQVALIYGESAGQLRPEDEIKRTYMESWGYDVDTFEDSNLGSLNPALYNTLYISNTVVANNIGDSFTDSDIGIVFDEYQLLLDLDMATAAWTQSGDSIDIIDNNHFITAPFAPGLQSIYSLPMEILSVGGTEAAGLEWLGRINGTGSLVVLDQGAPVLGGGSAAGRRVNLPFGRHTETNFNWDYLDSNGLLMVQRALEWSKASRCLDDDYRDDFNTVSWSNNDGSVNWLTDWSEQDGNGSGPGSGNARITGGELRLDDSPDDAGPRVRRDFNLNGADAAVLSIDYRLSNKVDLGSDKAFLQIKTDTLGWDDLADFSVYSGGAQGSLQFDISPYISPNTRIRLRITQGYNSGNKFIYFDNLRIGVCGNLN